MTAPNLHVVDAPDLPDDLTNLIAAVENLDVYLPPRVALRYLRELRAIREENYNFARMIASQQAMITRLAMRGSRR